MEDDHAIDDAARKIAAKPALKKHHLHNYTGPSDGNDTPTDSVGEDSRKKKGHLKWDEEVIAEHDQLRGTRMKIDEPNTPFYYDSGAESDGSHQKSPSRKRPTIDFDLLQDKLTDVVATCPSSPSSHGDSSVDDEKKRQFREHRKKHYNEIDKVRQFRSTHPDSFDDSMDGDNDDDNDAGDDADEDAGDDADEEV